MIGNWHRDETPGLTPPALPAYSGEEATFGEALGKGLLRGPLEIGQATATLLAPLIPSREDMPAWVPEGMTDKEDAFSLIEKMQRFKEEHLTPSAKEFTIAKQLTYGITMLPGMLAGGVPGLLAAGINPGADLIAQGVDSTTATEAALLNLGGTAAAVALPGAGSTLKQTLGLVAAGSGLGVAQDAAVSSILDARGYKEQALQYDPLNPVARIMDLGIGGAFGYLNMRGIQVEQAARNSLRQAELDAVDTVAQVKQAAASAPSDAAAAAHGQAVTAAAEALSTGAPVKVDAPPAPPRYGLVAFYQDLIAPEKYALSEEQADTVLTKVALFAITRGEDPEAWVGRAIKGVEGQGGTPSLAAALFQSDSANTFRTESRGSYSGQSDLTLRLEVKGEDVGRVDYTVYQGNPSIQMIEVDPGARRKGYGTMLLKELQRQFPETEIETGMMTADGAALFSAVPTRKVELPEIKAKQAELANKRAQVAQLQEIADRFHAIESPTKEQRAAYHRDIESWNDLTDDIEALENEVGDAKAFKTLFYQADDPAAPKGAVSFEADGRAVLHALQNPDVSTVIHELAHVFRRHLSKGEQYTIDSWLLSKRPGSKWGVADEEKFARAFERYVYDGEAPSAELAGPFAKLKGWMLEIYANLAGSPLKNSLSPQVRKVFDRLFVVDGLRVQVEQGRLLREQIGDPAAEILASQHLILGEEPDTPPAVDRTPRAPVPLDLPEAPDSVAAFLENTARVGAPLKELLEIEAGRIADSTAENFVIDGYRKAASHSTAPEWYLDLQRSLEASGNRMGKDSIANALKKTAAGQFAKLTTGQQQAVLAGLDALARESSSAAHAIDPRTLQLGDRVTLPDLSTRTVIKGEKGELWLDNGQRLKAGEALQILGEVDPTFRHLATVNDNPLDYRAESHLAELPDLDYVSHVETDGTEVRKKWRDTIDTAKTDLARERSRAGIYQRAAFCLGLGA